MIINHENVIQQLNTCVNCLQLAAERLKEIKMDTPETHHKLMLINGSLLTEAECLPDLMEFIAKEKPDPTLVVINLNGQLIY